MSRLCIILAVGAFLGLFITSCTKNKIEAEKQRYVLKVQISTDPVTMDPSLIEDGVSMEIIHNVMDGLFGHDAQGKRINQLAESWTVSKDGRRYEFALRHDARWSDDIPVRATDFVTAFRRALSPKVPAKLAPLLFSIRGAKAFHAGTASELAGVYEKDGKLVIELEEPTSYFLEVLTLANTLPLRQDILTDNGGNWPITAPATGPYRIAAYQPGRRFLLDKNDAYYGKKPTMYLIDVLIIQDDSTAVNLFEKGDLDILTRVPGTELPRLEAKGLIQREPFLATYYLGFNTRKAPANDLSFRRAVSGAIRRDEIVQALASGEVPARSWIPPGLEGSIPYQDPAPVFADSVKAFREKFARQGAGFPPVTAGFDSSPRNTMVMEKVESDLKNNLGIRVLLSNMDWKSFIGSLQSDPPTIYRMGWLAPFGDPIPHLEVFISHGLNNYTGWSSAEYDRLVAEIARLAPGPEREQKIRQAEKLLVDDQAVVVPIYHYVQQHAIAARLANVHANPFGVIPFNEVTLKDAHAH